MINNYILATFLIWNYYDKLYIDALNIASKIDAWYLTSNYYDIANIDSQIQTLNASIAWISNSGVD